MSDNRVQINMRIDKALLDEVDQRLKIVNARKTRDGEQQITRNDWFVNMTKWTVNELPHQAVRADLIKAWPGLPEEALGVEK